MTKKRRVWPDEVKRAVVQEYLSGKKTAKELAIENGFGHDVDLVLDAKRPNFQMKSRNGDWS